MAKAVAVFGASLLQLPLIQELQKQGKQVLVFDQNPQAPGLQQADEAYLHSFLDTPQVISILKKKPLQAIVTVGTDCSLAIAQVSEALSLPFMPVEIARLLTDKGKMRTFFAHNSIDQPPFLVLE